MQKFGGTSIGKFAVNIAEDIVRWVPFSRGQLLPPQAEEWSDGFRQQGAE